MGKVLLVATHNRGKVAEIVDIINEVGLEWRSLDELDLNLSVEETGETFEQNAIIKASAYASASGMLTLADDSGLEVDALDGQPGVHTARYGGAELSPRQRYELLLRELLDVPWGRRTARFRCVVALAGPDELHGTASGDCDGIIAMVPVGSGGFGYDPVFYLPDKGMTMSQLSPDEKRLISHRGRALRAMIPLLRAEADSHG